MDFEKTPDDPFVNFHIANTLFDDGRFKEATAYLSDCLKLTPPGNHYLAKVHALLVTCSGVLGRPEQALKYCQAGIDLFPEDRQLWFELGNLRLAAGDWNEARRAFKKVLRVQPRRTHIGVNAMLPALARHNLAVCYRAAGNPRESEHLWRRVTAEYPSFGPAWLGLTEILMTQNRKAEINALQNRLHAGQYADIILPALQARVALRKRNWSTSQIILEDALRKHPNVTWLRQLLADILLQVAGDREATEAHMRMILALDPANGPARARLAKAE